MRAHVPYAVHNTRHKQSSAEKQAAESQSLLGGMRDYIVKKKTDFFDSLDEMEKRLKVSQDRIEAE